MKFWRPIKSLSQVMRDHRLDQRKPATINAAICWDHGNNKRCVITSLSLTGMFLQVLEPDLPIGTPLQVYFYCNVDGTDKCCHEWVRVVGKHDGGVAVRFERFDNEHQSNMQMMLHQLYECAMTQQAATCTGSPVTTAMTSQPELKKANTA